MLTIRLQRTGTKNRASFRIVLAEAHRAAGKKALEVLGHYNPTSKDFAIKDQERLKYWVGQHVSISPTVHNLLVEKKMLEAKKVKSWSPKKKEGAAETPAQPVATAAPQPAPITEVPAETPAETSQA